MVSKSDHIYLLELREQALEEELAKALLQYSDDDMLVTELKRRRLYLQNELRQLQRSENADQKWR